MTLNSGREVVASVNTVTGWWAAWYPVLDLAPRALTVTDVDGVIHRFDLH